LDYHKTSEQLGLLKATNDVTEEASRTAQANAKAAKEEIEKLTTRSEQIGETINVAEKKIDDLIHSSANSAHDYTFETASQNNLSEALQDLQFNYVENSLVLIEDAIKKINDNNGDIGRIKEIIATLVENNKILKTTYSLDSNRVADNSHFKVIIYYKRGEGFPQQALTASRRLKGSGYKTDIWATNPGTLTDARSDIAKDFKGATSVIGSHRAAIVVSDQATRHGEEIKKLLSTLHDFEDIPVVAADMDPDEVFLQRLPEEPYPKTDIILVFVLTEKE
jgi:hypothetical protein